MTREEAIEAIKYSIGVFPVTDRAETALNMAVKALEQEPCKDAISRQAAIDATWLEPSYTDPLNVLTEVRDRITNLPSVIPSRPTEPCEDAISRHYLRKQFQEKCIGECSCCEWDSPYWCGLIDNAPPVNPPEREVLDKIRAEIEQNAYPIVHGVNNHEKGMTLYGILQIIDKYKAEIEPQESEDKE